uniref:Ovule protein n=1 Tax=Strongyloides venezuelensis TaxID=75913 RepID=A0A0K0G0R6_STRVS
MAMMAAVTSASKLTDNITKKKLHTKPCKQHPLYIFNLYTVILKERTSAGTNINVLYIGDVCICMHLSHNSVVDGRPFL